MIGLYLKSEDDPARDALVAGIKALIGRGVERREVVTFTPTSTNMSILTAAGQGGRATCSWLCAWPERSLEAVGFSPALRAFRGAWSAALVDQANRSLRAGGALVFPAQPGAEAKGWWTPAWLAEAVGVAPAAADAEYIVFRRGKGNTQPSVLRWFFEDAGLVALDMLQSTITRNEPLANLLVDGESAPRIVPQPWDSLEWDRFSTAPGRSDALVDTVIGTLNYGIGGVGYKVALLRHMIGHYLPASRGLSILDVGGATGVVAAELLLSCEAIEHATTCDPLVTRLVLAQRIANRFPERMTGRFALAHTTAEAMTYERSYDVISFLGSLLYVPRAETANVLRRAWERLKPNGLLVIHENIQSPSYVRDFEYMFTVPELEGFLAEFGQASHWLSTATVALEPSKVGERSVFRVLQKT
jgi:predicted O-methyltransferase YrrM